MITIEQINGEIAVLEEETPTYVVMQKLADLYTVRDHMGIGESETSTVAMKVKNGRVVYDGMSEFAEAIKNKDIYETLKIVDELMDTLSILNPKLYEGVMIKLREDL